MKISQIQPKSVPELRPSLNGVRANPSEAAATGAADQSQISNLSNYLTAAIGDSAAHSARLDSLASAVWNGEYSVSASTLSDGIIQSSLLFATA